MTLKDITGGDRGGLPLASVLTICIGVFAAGGLYWENRAQSERLEKLEQQQDGLYALRADMVAMRTALEAANGRLARIEQRLDQPRGQ